MSEPYTPEMIACGVPVREIAEQFSVRPPAIRRALERAGVCQRGARK